MHEAFCGKNNGLFRTCANSVYQASFRGGEGGGPGNEATYGSDKSEGMGVTNLFSHDFLVLGPILYAALFVPKWS